MVSLVISTTMSVYPNPSKEICGSSFTGRSLKSILYTGVSGIFNSRGDLMPHIYRTASQSFTILDLSHPQTNTDTIDESNETVDRPPAESTKYILLI